MAAAELMCCVISLVVSWNVWMMQLLKLGAVEGISDLSDYYVIWDMDMIATHHLPIHHTDILEGGRALHLGFPSSLSGASEPVRTHVNVGGAWPVGYGLGYRNLFGEQCESFLFNLSVLVMKL